MLDKFSRCLLMFARDSLDVFLCGQKMSAAMSNSIGCRGLRAQRAASAGCRSSEGPQC